MGRLTAAAWLCSVALAGAAVLPVSALGQAPDAIAGGQATFEYMCAPCHGRGSGDDGRAMLPGTDALRIKYRGEVPALLEERRDLTPELIRTFVRIGSWSMPPFRPTEITDAEIADLAAYLEAAANGRL